MTSEYITNLVLRGAGLAPTVTARPEQVPIDIDGLLGEESDRDQTFEHTLERLNDANPATRANSRILQDENQKDELVAERVRAVESAKPPPETVGSKPERKTESHHITAVIAERRENPAKKAIEAEKVSISHPRASYVEQAPASQRDLRSKKKTIGPRKRDAKGAENREASVIRPYSEQSISRPTMPLVSQNQKTIRVHIGTIEVRAVTPPASTIQAASRQPQSLLSLNQYLKKRNAGRP